MRECEGDPYRWGVIGILDALGTSEPKSDVEWRSALDRRLKILEDARLPPNSWRHGFFSLDPADSGKPVPSFDVTTEFLSFSDTVLFAFRVQPKPEAEAHALRAVLRRLGDWYVRAVLKGELYRGALSVGPYYKKGDSILGPAVNDAGRAYDQADWAGIVLTDAAGTLMVEPYVTEHPFAYSRWEVPLHPNCLGRSPTKRMWTLCWPTRCQLVEADLTPTKFWAKVAEIFDRTKRRDVERKRRNTKRYFDEMWKRGVKAREDASSMAAAKVLGLQ